MYKVRDAPFLDRRSIHDTIGETACWHLTKIGFARIRGRTIILTADDFTIRAGHADGALMPKTIYMDKMSVHLKIPKVNVVDGASGGGSITTYRKEGGSYLPKLELLYWLVKQLDLGIPQCSAVVGPAVGLGAARAAVSHFSVIAGDIGSLFNAGPKIVEGATFEEDLRYAIRWTCCV